MGCGYSPAARGAALRDPAHSPRGDLMATRTWKFDLPHCNLQFVARHMVVAKVIGRFDRFSGELSMDPENPAGGSVTVEIDASSINTNAADRDQHLRSP